MKNVHGDAVYTQETNRKLEVVRQIRKQCKVWFCMSTAFSRYTTEETDEKTNVPHP